MARPKRIDLPYSLYHVISRTQAGEAAFPDARDRSKFYEYLAEYSEMYGFRIHAWCLMPTHFHLLVESGNRPGLSLLLHRLLTAYTVYFNRRHKRHGHLFQGRFKSLIVDKAGYLLALSRYIHLNPVQAKMTTQPETYEGSSLPYYIHGGEPEFLYTKEILSWFQGDRKQYARFIREGLSEETKPPILQQRYVGGQAFARRMNLRMKEMAIPGSRSDRGIRKRQMLFKEEEKEKADMIEKIVAGYFGLPLDMIKNAVYSRGNAGYARTILIFLFRSYLPWTIKDIAKHFGLHGQRGVNYHLEKIGRNKRLDLICRKLKKELDNKI